MQVHVRTYIRTAKKSFVKVETYIADCNKKEGICFPPKLFATGSGSVVQYRSGKAILTAAHVCYLGDFEKEMSKRGGQVLLKVKDRTGQKTIVRVIKYNLHYDVCLLGVENLNLPALRISVKAPEYSEEVYNLSSPMGISKEDMVPVYRGMFAGNAYNKAYYSIPTIGGASGSPILNVRGELVGMIHSVHFRFHHMALSVTYKNLWNFLKDHQSNTDVYIKQPNNKAAIWLESEEEEEEEEDALERYFLRYLEKIRSN